MSTKPIVSYLTAEGADKLTAELASLKGSGREQLAKRLRSAIEQGDLSENADYTSAKEDQGFLEGRILELEQIINTAVIIDDLEQNLNEVGIGDHVTIQEEGSEAETYHLVGTKEADPVKGRISHESPTGKALMGHHLDDIVSVDTPAGIILLKILRIE